MSIQFSSEVTVITFTLEDGTTTITRASLSTVRVLEKQSALPPEKHHSVSDLDIMRRFIMQLANNSPTLCIEKDQDSSDEDEVGFFDDYSEDGSEDEDEHYKNEF